MSLPSVGRGVPPQREAVKQGPATTPSSPPSKSPPPSSPPTSGRGSASLSTPGSRSPASPQRQRAGRKSNLKRFLCPNQIRSINRTLTSDSQKTPNQRNSGDTPISDSQKTPNQRNSGDTPISDSEKTPSPYPDGGDPSVNWTREKSFTPTLTDLENSVHYDCRLDKVLRVALDYALPEELGHV